MKYTRKKHLSSAQIIVFGFLFAIFLGALLLMLPISSNSGDVTPFSDAIFTSTSAVCVTGLVVQDTATHWSAFGQFIILLLIQIGGLGVVTFAILIAMISGRKIGLMQRSTMQEAISAPKVAGIVKLTGFILKLTLIFELSGALAMMPVFCRDLGIKGVWYAIFHSISAFCNAGFDLMGINLKYSSLTSYSADYIINITIMLLIVIGGIGFLVWEDIITNKHHFKKYRMQTKVVLITTFILILLPSIYFFFKEFSNLPLSERIFASLFQGITPRTAGFNTVDLTALGAVSISIIIILMLIGGSPGSTAGGMKTTTVSVLLFSSISVFRRKHNVEAFGRRIGDDTIKNAAAILLMYILLFLTGGLIISEIEGLPLLECLFETASAVGTVGLTLGITPQLSQISRIILMILMFFGRVGGLTLIFATLSQNQNVAKKPIEKITVG